MIVFFSEPRLCYMPYKDAENQQKEFKFVPGKNIINQSDWKCIVEQYQDDFNNYYNKLFKVLKPTEPIGNTDMSIGEDKVDIYKLTVQEIYTLIENTFEIDDLKEYKSIENKGKERKSVFKAIEKQVRKVARFESKIQSKSKG